MPHPTEQVLGWELSFDPAIQRAFAGGMAEAMFRGVEPVETEWITWNKAAHRAMARIAAKCWAGVDQQARTVLVDVDNFHPMWNWPALHNLRSDSPGRALSFEGLDDADVRAGLTGIWDAARATPSYRVALDASARLQSDRSLMRRWAQLSQKGHAALAEAVRSEMIGDGARRGLEIVRCTYANTPLEPLAAAFRRYNRLVHEICFALLGLADQPPITITHSVGAIRCTFDEDGIPFLRLTAEDEELALHRLTNPVLLSTGTPLDGLHLVVGQTISLASPGFTCDLSLIPLRWAEGRWPVSQPSSP